MASSGSGYDLSAATFSPDGRIFQVEYATKAVVSPQAGTVLGIQTADGIVLGVSKPLLHKMIVPNTCSYKRIHHVATHAGLASTGCLPDARVLVTRAMDEAVDYHDTYGMAIPPHILADRLSHYMHYFTLHGALRPFGAAAVLAAYDATTQRPALYLMEPNGVAYQYYAVATGKGKQIAKTELEKLHLTTTTTTTSTTTTASTCRTTREAAQHICKILLLLHQENKDQGDKPLEVELSWLSAETQWNHVALPPAEVARAMAAAKEQLAQEEEHANDGADDQEEEPVMEEG